VGGGEVACHEGDPVGVVDEAVPVDQVGVGDAVLGDVDLRLAVVVGQAEIYITPSGWTSQPMSVNSGPWIRASSRSASLRSEALTTSLV
jgi:hypothetical protein